MSIFLFVLIIFTSYSVIQVIIQTQPGMETIRYLARLRTASWGLVVPFTCHSVFVLMNVKSRIEIYILKAFYIAGIILIIYVMFGSTLIWKDVYSWFGWNSELNTDNIFFWIFSTYLAAGNVLFFTTLYSIQKKTDNYRIQKLAQTILPYLIGGSIFTILYYCFIPSFNISAEAFIPYIGLTFASLIVYSIRKYQPDKSLSPSLLSSLTPIIPFDMILIEPNKNIQWSNKNKLIFNGFTQKEILGKQYDILFESPAVIEKEIIRMTKDPYYSASLETGCYTAQGNVQSLRISILGLRNEYNDISAYLLTFHALAQNTRLMEFLQKSYSISNREKEVAALLIDGCSYYEISDKLFISINTIKTHTRNIYQKTNTLNNSDFQRFCSNLIK